MTPRYFRDFSVSLSFLFTGVASSTDFVEVDGGDDDYILFPVFIENYITSYKYNNVSMFHFMYHCETPRINSAIHRNEYNLRYYIVCIELNS